MVQASTGQKKNPLSGPLIRAKAEEFASSLGKVNFKASTSWLNGFKERNAISFNSVCGESGSADGQAAGVWKSEVLS